MSQPSRVTSTVCSHWADREPSTVTTVQPSRKVRQAFPPAFRMGSTARVIPERKRTLGSWLVR